MIVRGKRAVIIGGAAGIGSELALALARAGADVLIGDVSAEAGMETAKRVAALGVSAQFEPCDLACDRSVRDFAEHAFSGGAPVDLLFNHAGRSLGGLLEEIGPADWHWLLDVNLIGLGRVMKWFLPNMIAQTCGWVVNTSSGLGLFHDAPIVAPYIATRAATIAYSRALATYLKNRGIGVSVFCPHSTLTDFGRSMRLVGVDRSTVRTMMSSFTPQSAESAANYLLAGVVSERFLISPVPETAERLVVMAQHLLEPGSDRLSGSPCQIVRRMQLRVPTENRNQVLRLLSDYAAAARKHNGCIACDAMVDAADLDVLMVYQVWSDAESIDGHCVAPDTLTFLRSVFEQGVSDISVDQFTNESRASYQQH